MSPTESQEMRPRANPAVTGRDLKDEFVLLGATGDRIHVLNDTAREIYLLCDGTRTLEEVADALVERYEVAREKALKDVREVVAELNRLGVLTVS